MVSVLRSKTVVEQVRDAQDGFFGVGELAEQARTEITRYEPRLKAWVALGDLDEATAAVAAAGGPDTAGAQDDRPLLGMSVGVKDIIDVQGLPTRCGSDTTDPAPKAQDAACVRRLRELGAVIQGKTVTTEFGYFSPGPTTNPFNDNHTPGGSSSGSAAAVGAGTIPFALGTQTAGSLTRPASYCGVAGLVLTPGSTPMDGISGLSSTLDSLGMLARSVGDLDYIYRHFADRAGESAADPEQLTAFIWEGSGVLNMDSNMAELLRITSGLLAEIGLATAPLDWDDHIRSLVEDHKTIMAYEAAHSLGEQLGQARSRVSPQLRSLLDDGDAVDETTYREAAFRGEISLRLLRRALGMIDEEVPASPVTSVIIGPAAQGAAPKRESGTGSPDFSRPWQLLGLPALTVPGARTSTGLPLGIQIIGPRGSEPTLLRLGRELEPLLRRLPSFSAEDARPTLKEMKW